MTTHEYKIKGASVKTGDVICTTDGGEKFISGQFWRLVGKLVPGDVDHIIIYVGPKGRCVEAGPKGVITFEADKEWDAERMHKRRGIIDEFYGVAMPLADKNLTEKEERRVREGVREYCIRQAKEKKPYNINFFDSGTEKAFYCSQLAYKAYFKYGINLNTGKGIPKIPGTKSIIFPQEIWSGCAHS